MARWLTLNQYLFLNKQYEKSYAEILSKKILSNKTDYPDYPPFHTIWISLLRDIVNATPRPVSAETPLIFYFLSTLQITRVSPRFDLKLPRNNMRGRIKHNWPLSIFTHQHGLSLVPLRPVSTAHQLNAQFLCRLDRETFRTRVSGGRKIKNDTTLTDDWWEREVNDSVLANAF